MATYNLKNYRALIVSKYKLYVTVFDVTSFIRQMLIVAIAISSVVFLGSPVIADPYSGCNSPTIKNIQISLNNRQNFLFKYQIFRGAKPGSPTVIYIPGGPGESSIGNPEIAVYMPDNFGLILTDPRGVGCNSSAPLSFTDYSTENSANDILSIIATSRLRPSDIILYGKSYGTVLATTVAFKNTLLKHEPFRKIIFEGTWGHSTNSEGTLNGFVTAWENYLVSHRNLSRQNIEKAIIDHHLDRKIMVNFLGAGLQVGQLNKRENILDKPLRWMTDGMNFGVFQRSFYDPQLINESSPESQDGIDVWKAIFCQELVDSADGSKELIYQNGQLKIQNTVSTSFHNCEGLRNTRPYDSAKMQLRERLVYLEGGSDPQTPPEQAKYHFKSQVNAADKIFITFDGMGHSPQYNTELSIPGAIRKIWAAGFAIHSIHAILDNSEVSIHIDR